jgi:hypothetical protein
VPRAASRRQSAAPMPPEAPRTAMTGRSVGIMRHVVRVGDGRTSPVASATGRGRHRFLPCAPGPRGTGARPHRRSSARGTRGACAHPHEETRCHDGSRSGDADVQEGRRGGVEHAAGRDARHGRAQADVAHAPQGARGRGRRREPEYSSRARRPAPRPRTSRPRCARSRRSRRSAEDGRPRLACDDAPGRRVGSPRASRYGYGCGSMVVG